MRAVDDDLEYYLSTPIEHTIIDPLHYWSNHSGALAQMGRDFSSCPGMRRSSLSSAQLTNK